MTSFPQLNFFDSLCLCRVSLASHTTYYGDHLPNLSDSYIPPAFVIMPRLGTVKKRTTAKKAKKATTSAKSTKSTKSTSTQSPNDDTAVDPDNVVKAELEPEPEPENPIQVDLHDKLVVLDLVRGWEIGQALRSKTKETPYRSRYNYYGEAYSFKNAQEMLDDAKPMDLKDATMLWTSLLHNSSLNWNGRRGVKKDYKRWTFKHWAGRNRGPTSLTVDARGSEHKQRIVSVSSSTVEK